MLDDDSLLNIFYLYRPFFLGEDKNDKNCFYGGDESWNKGRWWYRLAHVCQRWRNLIFGAASYLRLSLVCTNRTPVAKMLAHSPPLPLTVDYKGESSIIGEVKEGLSLALEQRDRLRHLRLFFPVPDLQRLVTALVVEFPILEYLILQSRVMEGIAFILPEALKAPNLRHLMLRGIIYPRSRLHPTALGLVTLHLTISTPSTYFQPNVLLRWISFMPQLESLVILFSFPVPNRAMERQLEQSTPIATHITLPNLQLFWFQGFSTYLEAVVC